MCQVNKWLAAKKKNKNKHLNVVRVMDHWKLARKSHCRKPESTFHLEICNTTDSVQSVPMLEWCWSYSFLWSILSSSLSSLPHSHIVTSWFPPKLVCAVCLVTQSCLTLCDPMDCGPLGSSSVGIFQARILKWVAMSSSRGSSQPRDWIQVPCIAADSL